MVNTRRKGSATTGIIIAAVVVVGLGVIAYFASDVFKTRVDAAADQYTHWTPENIAKDPVMYLNFCESQTKQALEKLKADEIALAQNEGKLTSMKEDADGKVNRGEQALKELKDLYTQNDSAAATWPVTWNGTQMDKDTLKRQIVSLDHDVDIQKNLQAKLDEGMKKIQVQKSKIEDTKAKANQQLAEIAANRQLVSVNAITQDLTTQLVNMKGALKATVDTAAEDNNGVVSLDQLTASAAAAPPSDVEFDKIMKKGK